MYLTLENASQYEGKLLDSSRKLSHYYPIKPFLHPSLGWCFVDRTKTVQRIPKEGVYFETVVSNTEKGGATHGEKKEAGNHTDQ